MPRAARLGDSLATIAPTMPPELVGPEAIDRLARVASLLPPLHRAEFECALADDEHYVTLKQGILIADGEPDRLVRFLTAAEPLNDAWQAVLRLAQGCAADAPWHGGVIELGLELAAAPGQNATPALNELTPTVYAVLRCADMQRSLETGCAFVAAALGQSGSQELDRTWTRCARACPEPARISQIGVMLGGSCPSLRVYVSQLPLRALHEYLVGIGWPGDRRQVQSLATILLDYADALTLSLDVEHNRVCRLGLECSFSETLGLGLRRRPLLERLTKLGLCTVEKADAFERWPGTLTPLNSQRQWAGDLIAQGLTRPESELGALERRHGQIKLSWPLDLPVSAKVSFGYEHVWIRRPNVAPQMPHSSGLHPRSTVDDAVASAVDWLLAARHQSGWWRDYFGTKSVDASDEWVSAYVGDALARVALEPAQSAADEVLDLLLTQRDRTFGWGYNVVLPPDGDSTTWALRLARSLGESEHERLTAGRSLLKSLTSPGGGVASHTEQGAAALDRVVEIGGSYEGYQAPHLCITAPAAILGISDTALPYLCTSQNTDGSWSSYWWDVDEYATAWAVEALAVSAAHRDVVAAAVEWCALQVGSDGAVASTIDGAPSPFATALALYALRIGGETEDARRAAERAQRWLLQQQAEDGSWEASARLRVPAPFVRRPWEPDQPMLQYIPDCGVWTTATVLVALSAGSRCPGRCRRAGGAGQTPRLVAPRSRTRTFAPRG
jgi:hypothetical protein